MDDRGKVIKGLEILTNGCEYIDCDDCCFYISTKPTRCGLREEQIQEEALALLKEQNDNIGHWVVLENCSNAGVYCSECQTKIFDHYPMKKKYSYFCPHCGTRMEGQAVK